MILGRVPFLASRLRGDVAWITWLYVPQEMRGHGVGRQMVEEWRAHIPRGIREIRLVPHEIDGVDPVPFWEKLGFHQDPDAAWIEEPEIRTMSRPLEG